MAKYNCKSVGIVGAGIQGVCIGLHLLKKKIPVTIFDKNEPGSFCSYGNEGHFSPYASLSLNRTDVLADVPAMLLSSTGPLALKWNYVPKMIPWFIKFILNTSKRKMMHTAKYMHQILDLALPAYDELFDEIDLDGLVENKGILYIWNDKDLKSRELEIKVRDELGVKQQLVNKHEIHDRYQSFERALNRYNVHEFHPSTIALIVLVIGVLAIVVLKIGFKLYYKYNIRTVRYVPMSIIHHEELV